MIVKTLELRKTPTLSKTLAQIGEQFKDAAENYGAKNFRRWMRGKGYKSLTVPKKDGTTRAVFAPEKQLKEIQRSLNPLFRTFEPESTESHGFRPGRSNKTAAVAIQNAMLEGGNYTLIGQDLKEAFPSVKARTIYELIGRLIPSWSTWKKRSITRLLTHEGRLATGAPTSPTVLNLILAEMDSELTKLARRFGGRYVRYADDLVISIGTHKKSSISEVERELWRIIKKFGMKPHPKKHYHKRIYKDSPVAEVVGIQLNPSELKAKKTQRRKLRAWTFRALRELRETPNGSRYWRNRMEGLKRYVKFISSRPRDAPAIAQ
jgi:hypothetical protein